MTDKIKFSIDGKEYLAEPSESIWDVAKKKQYRYSTLVLLT
jgi:hypothetical protein